MPTFSKQDRLKSRKTISRLFKGGNSFVAYPLRVVWLLRAEEKADGSENGGDDVGKEGTPECVAQVAITVPKKNFKTAVLRNLLKRRIREAYRLQKHELHTKLADRPIALMLMYIAKEELSFAEIEAGIKKMIRKFPG